MYQLWIGYKSSRDSSEHHCRISGLSSEPSGGIIFAMSGASGAPPESRHPSISPQSQTLKDAYQFTWSYWNGHGSIPAGCGSWTSRLQENLLPWSQRLSSASSTYIITFAPSCYRGYIFRRVQKLMENQMLSLIIKTWDFTNCFGKSITVHGRSWREDPAFSDVKDYKLGISARSLFHRESFIAHWILS